jgi:hypothetical protein
VSLIAAALCVATFCASPRSATSGYSTPASPFVLLLPWRQSYAAARISWQARLPLQNSPELFNSARSVLESSVEGITGRGDIVPSNLF